MVIVGHMSSKSTFGAKNTGQKFLTPKNFWWCRNVCHDSCPGVIFGAGRGGAAPSFSGAGQSWKFSGPGRPGAAISPGVGAGRGGAGSASLVLTIQNKCKIPATGKHQLDIFTSSLRFIDKSQYINISNFLWHMFVCFDCCLQGCKCITWKFQFCLEFWNPGGGYVWALIWG